MARRTASSLTLPVASRILPRLVRGPNCGMGFGRFCSASIATLLLDATGLGRILIPTPIV